jgi:hypothetical protein
VLEAFASFILFEQIWLRGRQSPSKAVLRVCRPNVTNGQKIFINKGRLTVPDNPIIPLIRGDETGPDIWAVSLRVFDSAVENVYGGKKKTAWFELFSGQVSRRRCLQTGRIKIAPIFIFDLTNRNKENKSKRYDEKISCKRVRNGCRDPVLNRCLCCRT